jgi:hypothetical protein
MVVEPFLKVTVPDTLGDVFASVAVNVTFCPAEMGLAEDASVVVVAAGATVTLNAGEVPAAYVLSPEY